MSVLSLSFHHFVDPYRCIRGYATFGDRVFAQDVQLLADGDGAVAMLKRKIPDDRATDAMREALDRTTALGELEERSAELGHELSRWLGHNDESIAFCDRCGARIYARHRALNIRDGEALTERCPSPPN